jgi:homoserine kinase
MCSRCDFPGNWTIVAVTPAFELETRVARAVLPDEVAHRHAVLNVQRAAFLVAQIIQGRREGLREAMKDYLHQPYRSKLIPGLPEILAMADREGFLGVALSGAGPTVIALADSHESEIGLQIQQIFGRHGLSSQVRLLKADQQGLTLESLRNAQQ